MNAADVIRESVTEVQRLRQESRAVPWIGEAVTHLKRLQGRRFAGTYADLLNSRQYEAGARFFLDELYGDRDYAERDAQFAKIATAIEKLFPRDVAATAAALARLHALTESLDHAMARAARLSGPDDAGNYVVAWKEVGRPADRQLQLDSVVALGAELARLTRVPGLRLMLRMMRGPASAAGLNSLQRFLESGFDTFAAIAKLRGGAEAFLDTIRKREQHLIDFLFAGDAAVCEAEVRRILGDAAA
jgi:hypothetical protein